jgi:hypothetical protein
MNKPIKLAQPPIDTYRQQIQVLRILSNHLAASLSPRPYNITEIAELTGLKDEKEVQRYLYILEGQKLVSPFPEGDFTSKSWQITKIGIQAVKEIARLSA